MRYLSPAMLPLVFLLIAAPISLGQTTLEFCREVPGPPFSCIGPSAVFTTNERFVWVLVRILQPGPYETSVEWIAPDASTYATQRFSWNQSRGLVLRARIPVQGQKSETLPGLWTVRVLVNARPVASGQFTLQLVGEPNIFHPLLGPVSISKAGTARGVESFEPVNETAEFKLGDPVWAWARLSFSPLQGDQLGKVLIRRWRWIAPSGEVLDGRENRWGPTQQGWAIMTSWDRLPALEGRVQQPNGLWQVEFAVEDIVVIPRSKLSFRISP